MTNPSGHTTIPLRSLPFLSVATQYGVPLSMLGFWMARIFFSNPMIRMLPHVEEILERLVGKEQNGSYRTDDHEQQHRRHPRGW